MSYRAIPVNIALDMVMAVGKSMGLKQKIEVSDHTVDVKLTLPDTDAQAWDGNHFRHSNIYMRGYANPVKPVVNHNPELENKDTVDVEQSDVAEDTDGEHDPESEPADADEGKHVDLISSTRYRDYMRQDLVSQLLTPQEQWKLIAYGILGLGMLVFFQMIVIFWINGGGPA